MKVANLILFVLVLLGAALGVWLVFNHFPWLYMQDGDHVMKVLKEVTINKNFSDFRFQNIPGWVEGGEIGKALDRYNFIQHFLAYTLANACGMLVVWWGEGKIFHIRADTNWKIAFPMSFLPILCLGTPLVDASDQWYSFLIMTNWLVILIVWWYSFIYHALPQKKRNPKKSSIVSVSRA